MTREMTWGTWAVCLGVCVLLCIGGCAEPPLVPFTNAEQWVFDQLARGKQADLLEFSSDEKDRAIRGVFVSGLLAPNVFWRQRGCQLAS